MPENIRDNVTNYFTKRSSTILSLRNSKYIDATKLYDNYLIPKGSIALNGVSLTITNINQLKHTFSVTIIPYTFKHTNFKIACKPNSF